MLNLRARQDSIWLRMSVLPHIFRALFSVGVGKSLRLLRHAFLIFADDVASWMGRSGLYDIIHHLQIRDALNPSNCWRYLSWASVSSCHHQLSATSVR